ncbi:50S ribosomal protein L25/general stress protein Ctc [Komagataeibacter swingsii]|uniref:Large ribosomal subunit protein bL25 n=1 Tax=Komagataeibacter swingsii TaxID=215220 RepID=A0A2V4RCX5_9PROT|nr:50S ribosomal protein L25/general stress protein Ctc [Komagataeibacter swingsii]AHI26710.1 50S ribosomal protein L25/general stress protein Ctc [Komagataeibacter xylinus E25]RFO99203.1 50S ribosomal protein L25/general stress protein Ctc [Komagataeibacter xylinus]NVN37561.1 50S ribosomal protein L25/general stress protein Ctc [Komagataeibacter swingsii]PYD69920.1 50S ribosomal protein L25 [Komagataeibacter swingsii]RFO99408.1 50S ribosomal protein L25/general stress protein Ctc [Komagataeib
MTKFTKIEVSSRAKAGKGAARATRRAGHVPGVIYGGGQEPTLIALDPRIVHRELHKSGWRSRIYDISVAGGPSVHALLREIQLHPVTDAPLHVDYQRLAAGHKVHVEVEVRFEGEELSPGVKRGGVMNIVRHTVDVVVDPANIPEFFTADLSKLDFHDNVRWSDLKGTEHVTPVLHDNNFVIANVAPPSVDEEAEAAEAAEGAAEG